MNTERHDQVRLMFYGCSHRPKVSAISSPQVGKLSLCYTCGRMRVVRGMETTWKKAVISCQSCSWKIPNNGRFGKKRFIALAVRHANSYMHRVNILHDGILDVIKPQHFKQVPLIDDLLLP